MRPGSRDLLQQRRATRLAAELARNIVDLVRGDGQRSRARQLRLWRWQQRGLAAEQAGSFQLLDRLAPVRARERATELPVSQRAAPAQQGQQLRRLCVSGDLLVRDCLLTERDAQSAPATHARGQEEPQAGSGRHAIAAADPMRQRDLLCGQQGFEVEQGLQRQRFRDLAAVLQFNDEAGLQRGAEAYLHQLAGTDRCQQLWRDVPGEGAGKRRVEGDFCEALRFGGHGRQPGDGHNQYSKCGGAGAQRMVKTSESGPIRPLLSRAAMARLTKFCGTKPSQVMLVAPSSSNCS